MKNNRCESNDRKMQDTGMETAVTNNYAEYNMYNHSQMLKATFAG